MVRGGHIELCMIERLSMHTRTIVEIILTCGATCPLNAVVTLESSLRNAAEFGQRRKIFKSGMELSEGEDSQSHKAEGMYQCFSSLKCREPNTEIFSRYPTQPC